MMTYHIIGCTDKGPVRQANEDHILVGRFIKNRGEIDIRVQEDDDFVTAYGLILAVADGIGGVAGGATASRLALTAFERQFYSVEKDQANMAVYMDSIQSAAMRANETVLKAALGNDALAGMGCTLAGICLTPQGYIVFNAGDSRVYRYRNGILKPLSKDDTLTAMAVAAGRMTLEEAEQADARHTLTNCLGSSTFELRIEPGPELREQDLILICSDGLHDLVAHEELESIISQGETPEAVIYGLVSKAIEQGGHDNISIIVLNNICRSESNSPSDELKVEEVPAD